MYEWDDILIVGDSFCAERDQLYHWPAIFANKLTNENKINPRDSPVWLKVERILREQLTHCVS